MVKVIFSFVILLIESITLRLFHESKASATLNLTIDELMSLVGKTRFGFESSHRGYSVGRSFLFLLIVLVG